MCTVFYHIVVIFGLDKAIVDELVKPRFTEGFLAPTLDAKKGRKFPLTPMGVAFKHLPQPLKKSYLMFRDPKTA